MDVGTVIVVDVDEVDGTTVDAKEVAVAVDEAVDDEVVVVVAAMVAVEVGV